MLVLLPKLFQNYSQCEKNNKFDDEMDPLLSEDQWLYFCQDFKLQLICKFQAENANYLHTVFSVCASHTKSRHAYMSYNNFLRAIHVIFAEGQEVHTDFAKYLNAILSSANIGYSKFVSVKGQTPMSNILKPLTVVLVELVRETA